MKIITIEQPKIRPPFYKILYLQVITAIVLGVLVGYFFPDLGEKLKPLGDAFIKLIKMVIVPIIFLAVVSGGARMVLNGTIPLAENPIEEEANLVRRIEVVDP